MKNNILFIATVGFCTLAACTKQVTPQDEPITPPEGKVALTFLAANDTSSSVKATISGNDFLWDNKDDLAIFDGSDVNVFAVDSTSISSDRKSAAFSGFAAPVEQYIAISPASAAKYADSQLSVTIPTSQVVDATHTMDPAAIASIAKTQAEGGMVLSNIFSLIKISINESGIKSVFFEGKNEEKISGSATVNTSDLSIGGANKTSVTLTHKDGEFPTGDYYISIYPTTLSKGFRIVLTTTETAKACKSSSASKIFVRNKGVDFGDITDVSGWAPSTLNTVDHLKIWAKVADTYGSKETVKLGKDMDLGGMEWTPVEMNGIFDGQNHTIKNFKVTADLKISGFIQGLRGTFKNVVFGAADDAFSKIECCHTVTNDWTYVGLIAYCNANAKVENVTNYIPVTILEGTDAKVRAGGIVGIGKGSVTIKNCTNYADIKCLATNFTDTDDRKGIGGIAGAFDTAVSTLNGCTNRGNISNNCEKMVNVGGIIGWINGGKAISCKNYGIVSNNTTAAINMGGIAGSTVNSTAGKACTFSLCENHGELKLTKASTKSGLGGIVGQLTESGRIEGCSNAANVYSTVQNGNMFFGGIVGTIKGSGATITKTDKDVHTVNSGDLIQDQDFTATLIVGGIAGYVAPDNAGTAIFSYCDNTGDIKNLNQTSSQSVRLGGIAGHDNKASVFSNCTNTGDILATGNNNNWTPHIGGLIAGTGLPGSITNCGCDCEITVNNGKAGALVGGIAAKINPSTTTAFNNCTAAVHLVVPATTEMNVGGLAGYCEVASKETTLFENCIVKAHTGVSNNEIISCSNTNLNGYTGVLVGKSSGTAKATLHFGSADQKVSVQKGTITDSTNSTSQDITDNGLFVGKKINCTTLKLDSSNYALFD